MPKCQIYSVSVCVRPPWFVCACVGASVSAGCLRRAVCCGNKWLCATSLGVERVCACMRGRHVCMCTCACMCACMRGRHVCMCTCMCAGVPACTDVMCACMCTDMCTCMSTCGNLGLGCCPRRRHVRRRTCVHRRHVYRHVHLHVYLHVDLW